MTTCTLTSNGKIGVHQELDVYNETGLRVGRIHHRERRGFWHIVDNAGRLVSSARTLDQAKAFAWNHNFKHPLAVHEEMVVNAIEHRRRLAEKHFGVELANYMRRIIEEGSNSAKEDAASLLDHIEAVAVERVDFNFGFNMQADIPKVPAPQRTARGEVV